MYLCATLNILLEIQIVKQISVVIIEYSEQQKLWFLKKKLLHNPKKKELLRTGYHTKRYLIWKAKRKHSAFCFLFRIWNPEIDMLFTEKLSLQYFYILNREK